MKFILTDNNQFLKLEEYDSLEWRQMENYFTRKVKDFYFKKNKATKVGKFWSNNWDGNVKFFNAAGKLPVGLWLELVNMCTEFKYDLEIEGIKTLIDNDVKYEEVKSFMIEKIYELNNFEDREFQIDSVYKLAKYKKAQVQIATSGGKTLITWSLFSWLKSQGKIKKLLVIVPRKSLVSQAYGDFMRYNDWKTNSNLKVSQWNSDVNTYTDDCDILISMFQTLSTKPDDLFKQFDAVIVDESDVAIDKSVRKILEEKCSHVEYKFGMSGTIETIENQKTADFFTSQRVIGPIVNHVTAKYLIDNGYSTKVDVKCIVLDYMPKDARKKMAYLYETKTSEDGTKLFRLEQNLVRENKDRLRFVIDLLNRTTKNTLLLFSDVKGQYGKLIYDGIREINAEKEVYYIDGSTSENSREEFKKRMEEGNNKIMIASYGTFSRGVSINNLHNIIMAESYKASNIILQTIGRGMRLQEDKDFVTLIDIVDDFSCSYEIDGKKKRFKNYIVKHFESRKEIYQQEQHPFSVTKMKL